MTALLLRMMSFFKVPPMGQQLNDDRLQPHWEQEQRQMPGADDGEKKKKKKLILDQCEPVRTAGWQMVPVQADPRTVARSKKYQTRIALGFIK